MVEMKKGKKMNFKIMKRIIISLFCVFLLKDISAQSYHIGDLYTAPDGSQGVVYYLHPDGSGGWVVRLNDDATYCYWGASTDVPGLANEYMSSQLLLADTMGYSNTQIIRNYQNSSTYAAGVVDFANGWVLPSPAQLSMLYGRMPFITSAIQNAGGTLPNGHYWCSAEYDASRAWTVSFQSGTFDPRSKNSYNISVRSVRSFYCTGNEDMGYIWSTGATTSSITVSPEETTMYTVTVFNSGGCADTVEQTIVVYATSNTDTTVSVCGNYEWNGQIYTESGDYTIVTPGEGGCNSVATLHLTVSVTPDVTVTLTDDTICVGDNVTLEALVLNSDALVTPPITPSVAVGDILCTDGTIVKSSAYATSGKTAMGIIFYVDNTDEHGWAIHLQDQVSSLVWSTSEYDVPGLYNYNGLNAYLDIDGYGNTQIIRSIGNSSSYPAAWAVDFANGWYLPAAGQMRLIMTLLPLLNSSLSLVGGSPFSMNSDFNYWSSTESSSGAAWAVSNRGYLSAYSKINTVYSRHAVRSVRSF